MKAILAMDPHRVIGYKGRIPWHYSEDFKWFKATTMGGNLLMGRSTYESIGKPLPGRYTYILTTDSAKILLPPGTLSAYVDEKLINDMSPEMQNKTWLCGGAKVYKHFLPKCDEVYVTHIMEDFEGDTFMPEFEHMFPNAQILKETSDFWIVKYSK